MAGPPLIPDVAPFPNLQTLLGKVRFDAQEATADSSPQSAATVTPPAGEHPDKNAPFSALHQIARHLAAPERPKSAPAQDRPQVFRETPPQETGPPATPEATSSPDVAFKELLETTVAAQEKPAKTTSKQLPVLPVSKDMLLSMAEIPNAIITKDAGAPAQQLAPFPADLEPLSDLPAETPQIFPSPDQWNENQPVTLNQEFTEPTHVEISPMMGLRTDAQEPDDSAPIQRLVAADTDDGDQDIPILLQPAESPASSGWTMKLGGTLLAATSLAAVVFALVQWVGYWSLLAPPKPGVEVALANAKFWTVCCGSAAVGLMALGIGSLRLRRWALRITHAAGWMVVIFALVGFAVASAGYFFVVPQGQAGIPGFGKLLSIGGIVFVGLPLLVISLYQSKALPLACARHDPIPRWTDHTPEPLLMLWLPCIALAVVLLGLASVGGVFPFFGKLLSGPGGMATSIGCSLLFLISAWLLARKDGAGWWMALLCMGFLFGSAVWTFLTIPWSNFQAALGSTAPLASPSGTAPVSKLPSLLLLAAFAPLCLTLIMARGVIWPHEEEKQSPTDAES